MHKTFMRFWTLVFLQIVIVGNLQVLPANAIYGFSLPFLYIIAVIFFLLPCCYMTAKLAANYPQTGGAYIWCEKAFGSKVGFFTVTILWLSNLLWYPSIFALLAANLAYLFNPNFAQIKAFIVMVSISFFWIITALNCVGVKPSTKVSVISSVLGILFPMIIISFAGLNWWLSGKPLAITTEMTPWFPDFRHFANIGFLIAVVVSLFGMEVTAVHAGDVVDPKKNYPRSLLFSSCLLVILLISAQLSIAVIVPPDKLNLVTGLLDALVLFFNESGSPHLLFFVLLLVWLGNIGSIAAWMLGSTRGMFVACCRNQVLPFFEKTNRYEAPIGVLIAEAIIFTCASAVFLMFPGIVDAFWLLLVLASELTLIYYLVLFAASIRLGCSATLMILGILTTLLAFILGFFPPPNLSAFDTKLFWSLMIFGIGFSLVLPWLLLTKKN